MTALHFIRDSLPKWFNNPIGARELTHRLRRGSSFFLLFLFLLVAATHVVSVWMFIEEGGSADELSHEYVYRMSAAIAAMVFLAVPFFSATSINVERQRDCWDFIATSPLNSASILLGKFLSSILFVWIFLFSLIPIYGVCMTRGDVAIEEIVIPFYLLTEITIVLSLFGLMSSIWFRKYRTAVTAAFGLSFGYFFLFPLILVPWYTFNLNHNLPQSPLIGLPIFASPIALIILYYNIPIANTHPDSLYAYCHSHLFFSHLIAAHFVAAGIAISFIAGWAAWEFSRLRMRDKQQNWMLTQLLTFQKNRWGRWFLLFQRERTFPGHYKSITVKDLNEINGPFQIRLLGVIVLWFTVGLGILGLFRMDGIDPSLQGLDEMPYIVHWIIPLLILPFAVSSIRIEKDGTTWELLRTTTLDSRQILQGKALAGFYVFQARLGAFYGLTATLGLTTAAPFEWYLPGQWGYGFASNNLPLELLLGSVLICMVWGRFYMDLGLVISSHCKTTVSAYVWSFAAAFSFIVGFGYFSPLFGSQAIESWKTILEWISPIGVYDLGVRMAWSPLPGTQVMGKGPEWWGHLAVHTIYVLCLSYLFRRLAARRLSRCEP